jgi:enoyl-CoA hydratase/carnithine racemase
MEGVMEFRTLLFDKRASIAYVTINRPDKLNALNQTVLGELRDCFGAIRNDEQVRAVIVAGAGEKAFVAGADVSEIAAANSLIAREMSLQAQGVFDSIENLGKPVIAAIRGYALGGGCELAMACTLRVASENARFGQPEVKLGIIPGYGGTQRLSRLVGKGRAMEIILTGEMITVQEAYRIGLVNRVVPETDLIGAAESMARKVIANAPLAVKFSIEAVNHGMEMTQREGEFLEATLFGLCCGTEDMKEGTHAFLEKRPPNFSGR